MAKQLKHIILLFIFTASASFGQSITIFDYDFTDYPSVKAKFHASGPSGKVLKGYSPPDFILYENGLQRTMNYISDCGEGPLPLETSIVIAVDVSTSMEGENLMIAKSGAMKLIDLLYGVNSEIALTSFASNSNINIDFTNVKSSLYEAVNGLETKSGSNLDSAVLGYQTGAISVAEYASHDKAIILITDDIDFPGYQDVIQKANEISAKIYAIVINSKASPNITEAAESTEGKSFDEITTVRQAEDALTIIVRELQNLDPCSMRWTSGGCDLLRTIELEIKKDDISLKSDYIIPSLNLPYLEFSPYNFIEFGYVAPGSSLEKYISVTARNGDIKITNVQSANTKFLISDSDSTLVFTLKKDSAWTIKIKYRANDTLYNYGYFDITTNTKYDNACSGKRFFVAGGSYSGNADRSSLVVEQPNGGEVFAVGADTLITWEGILPSDTVGIELSTDSGKSWAMITDTAASLDFNWRVPNVESPNCLIRVNQLSKINHRNKVQFLLGHSGAITGLAWSPGDINLASSSTDDSLKIWKLETGEQVRNTYESSISFEDIDWSPAPDDYILSANLKKYAIVWISNLKDILPANEGSITNVRWSPVKKGDTLFAAAGTKNGKILIWAYRGFGFDPILKHILNGHGSDVNSVEWNYAGDKLASGGNDGKLLIWDAGSGALLNSLFDYEYPVNSISWSPDGKKLAVAGNSNQIDIWDLEKKSVTYSLFLEQPVINAVAWGPKDDFIAAAAGRRVYLWNSSNDLKYYTYELHSNTVSNISWNHEGDKIATGDLKGEIHIWDPMEKPFDRSVIQSDVSDTIFTITMPNAKTHNLVFKPTIIGNSKDSVFAGFFENNSNFRLRIDSIRLAGSSNNIYKLKRINYPQYVEPGGRFDLEINFQPGIPMIISDTILTYSQTGLLKNTLRGRGVEPKLTLLQSRIDFGRVNLGRDSIISTQIFRNVSLDPILIKSISIIGPGGDYFERLGIASGFMVGPNAEYSDSINFSPEITGRFSSELIIRYNQIDSVGVIQLFGEGVAPRISDSEIILPSLICPNGRIDTSIIIRNVGKGILEIDTIMLNPDSPPDFELIQPFLSGDIQPGETGSVHIAFSSTYAGPKSVQLILKHNLDEQLQDSTVIQISAALDSVAFDLSADSVYFRDLSPMVEAYDSIYIYNTGDVPLNWEVPVDFEYFTIESIQPETTLPADSSLIKIKFKGGEEDETYDTTYIFYDVCGNGAELKMIAAVGKNDARIATVGAVEFPVVVCDGVVIDTTIYIENIGTTPLAVDEASFEGKSKDEFSICNSASAFVVPPGNIDSLMICYSPVGQERKEARLILKTNAKNQPNGVKTIELSGRKEISSFSLSHQKQRFPNVPAYSEKSAPIKIYNNGSVPIAWKLKFPVVIGKFEIVDIRPPITLPYGDSSEVTIRFTGGEPDSSYTESYLFVDSCNNARRFTFEANVRGSNYVEIKAGDISAEPGEIVDLPIYIINPKNIDLSATSGFETTLIFDGTLLVPVDKSKTGVLDGETRVVELVIYRPEISSGLLTSVRCYVSLGANDSTIIRLKDSKPIDDNRYYMKEESGLFTLLGVCRQNGDRLIGNSGILKLEQNSPNPADRTTTISFTPIEKGLCELELYNIYGRKVAVLFREFVEPKEYSVTFDAAKYPIGIYFYILRTKSQSVLKKMLIHR